MLIDTMAAVH